MEVKSLKYIEGILRFTGMWDLPIILETTMEEGDVDIAPILFGFFDRNNGKPAKVISETDRFAIKLTKRSHLNINYTCERDNGKLVRFGIMLVMPKDSDERDVDLKEGQSRSTMSNTALSIENTLTSLAGRHVVPRPVRLCRIFTK